MALAGFPEVVVRRGVIAWTGGDVTGAAGGEPLELAPVRARP
jgi:hypothetical protein